MTPLKRSQGLGRVTRCSSHLTPLISENDPFSPKFDPPVGDKPGDLFNYLMACQALAYESTILKLQPNAQMHKRHLKYLLKEFDALTIKRAISYASTRCRNPFGIRWIKTYARMFKNVL